MIRIATLRAAGLSAEQITDVVRAIEQSSKIRRLHQKDLSGPCYVYLLVSPKTRNPFYIGISKYPGYRFYQHKTDTGSAAWPELNRLLDLGYCPTRIYKVFKKCADRNSALALEHRLITSTPGLLNRDRRLSQIYTQEVAA